ncbi:MAG: PglZ domain-containing protein, partial [Calditrichia bacterium]|nr:PglZ domain-containing protein [Calditrichia bacterium]
KPNGEIKYFKVFSNDEIKRVKDNIQQVIKSDISALVVNSVDIIAHSRADTPVLKEIAPNEKAYRQLSQTWFEHSPLFEFFKELSRTKVKIVLTSDHGSIRVLRGAKVIADKETSVNLRYKFGRNLKVNKKQALILKNLSRFRMPNMADNLDFILAKEDHYFVYPTNYHHYLSHYKDSFQHGGISMEEMLIPVITLTGKK